MRVSEAVGKFLKRYREEHGLTMDDIATASQRYGSGWSSATIVSLERGGSKADSLPVLILLAQTLNDLTGDNMTLASVFGVMGASDEDFCMDLTESVHLDAGDIHDMLVGEQFHLIPIPPFGSKEYRQFKKDLFSSAAEALRDREPPVKDAPEYEARRNHVPTFAEKRAAEKAEVSAETFGAWCIHLYGHSLDDEARARAGEGASPQKRGRATRTIVEEVKAKIEEIADWRAEAAINGDL